MKLLGTFLIALSLIGCDATQRGFEKAYSPGVISWEAQPAYPEQSGPFTAEVHPCVNIEAKAALVWDAMQTVKKEDEKDAIINYLQRQVKTDRSLVVLQAGVEFLYSEDPMPKKERFIEAAKAACVRHFGSIMDRSHV